MASLNYVLRDPNLDKESLMYLVIRFDSKQIKYSLGKKLKIHPHIWDKKAQCAITKNSHPQLIKHKLKLSQEDIEVKYKPFNIELNRCKEKAERILNYFKYNKISLTKENFTKEFNQRIRSEKSTTPSISLNEYIEQFIKETTDGTRKIKVRNAQKKYEYSTIKKFKSFHSQFNYFQNENKRKYNFNDIDFVFYNKFIDFFYKKDYSANTVGKHLKVLKTLLKYSYEDGLHTNIIFENKAFEAPSVETDQIYLTENEIERIRQLDLSGNPTLDVARDIFLCGCYTALRYSDYSRISKQHIQKNDNGNMFINMVTQKTSERVIIPIRPQLLGILEKYDFTLPKSHEQKINKRIKEIGELAEINETVTVEKLKGGVKVAETYKKYELIVTHTARRSGATNMYKAKIPAYDIMKITGHTTEQNFLKYLRISKRENAEILSSHPYFNGN